MTSGGIWLTMTESSLVLVKAFEDWKEFLIDLKWFKRLFELEEAAAAVRFTVFGLSGLIKKEVETELEKMPLAEPFDAMFI